MKNNLRELTITEEFDYNFLTSVLSSYKSPRLKINDLLKKGEIIRVKKGLYVFGPQLARQPYSRETLANLIYGPSCISLEYALSFYGLIPERVEALTSVTNKRKKIFHTPVGVFTYKYLNPNLFAHGTSLHTVDARHTIRIATKEKALCDLLYFAESFKNIPAVRDYLLESLRIEKSEIKKFDPKRLKELSEIYGHNVQLLYQFYQSLL